MELKIDKATMLREIIVRLERERDEMRAGFEEARLTSIEAPGRMQSRYDTMGVEAAWVADGLAKNLDERNEALRKLKALRLPDAPEHVALGCLVGIGSNSDLVEKLYFILPAAGGMSIPVEGNSLDIQTVTLQAPVGRTLIGKSIDDEVTIRKDREDPDIVVFLA